MATKIFAGIFKWLCIPAVMGALGFYLLGPRIGNSAFLTAKVEPVKEMIEDGTAGTSSGPIDVPEPKGRFSDVKVDIDLTEDDKSKPDSATEKPKKTSYFSPDAGKSYAEIPEGLPNTPGDSPETAPASTENTTGW